MSVMRKIIKAWLRTGFAVAALAIGVSGGGAQAQFGAWGGWGWGLMGGGGQISNRMTLQYMNQRSLAAANAAYAARSNGPYQRSVYDNNPNAYFNSVRSNTDFYPRFDPSTRRTIDSQALAMRDVTPRVTPRPSPTPTTEAEPAARTVPLLSFFDAMGLLHWPADAPTQGTLGEQKQAASQSAEFVYREVKGQGYASIGAITDARDKLIAYGRPALEWLDAQASPAVVDTFHRFLLSLYNSLGESAFPGTSNPGR